MKILLPYCLSLVLFIGLDSLWLGVLMKHWFVQKLSHLLAPQITLWPAVIFYLLYSGALTFFVLRPALAHSSLGIAALHGAVFGCITYATYDLTNAATLKDWPHIVTLVDILWGTAVCCIVSVLTVWILTNLVPTFYS